MKLGAFGMADSVGRFDQMKSAKSDAKASDVAAILSPRAVSKLNPRKVSSALSNVSTEDAKDFSRILKKEVEPKPLDDSAPDASDKEAMVGASAAMSRFDGPKNSDRSQNEPQTEETPVSTVKNESSNAQTRSSKLSSAEAVDDRVDEIIQSLEQTSDTELSMRHLSMREFLAKMEGEFGIEPSAVVNAFAKLDQAALMAPPEQTADAVLSQLKLTPDQMPKAARFYREMLNETGDSALSETLVGIEGGISLQVLSEQDVAMEKLQKSILNLNDAFALRSENTVTTEQALVAASNGGPLDKLETKADEKSNESKFASLGAALSAATAGLDGVAANNANSGGSNGSNSNKSKSDTPQPREFSSIESALAASAFKMPPGEASATPLAAGTSTSAALAASLMNQSSDGTTTNAQDLVRHAQILVKDGGGEMKMQLKPEGVGDVTLKVSVKDGQVAIQMLTETDSAKKFLESNLDDLKTSLAQHKLHVDALKIEVGGEMAKQRFEQAQQDSSREQARQMAQDFMGQFRQDREGFRQGFNDSAGFRNYGQPKRNSLPEIEPVVVASGSQKQSSGERRLNLVA